MTAPLVEAGGLLAISRPDGYWVLDCPSRRLIRMAPNLFEERRRAGKLPQPVHSSHGPGGGQRTHVTLIVTQACNLRCRYCSVSADHQRLTMPPALAGRTAELVREHYPHSNVAVSFFGGEPTLNVAAIEAACDGFSAMGRDTGRAVSFSIATNGMIGRRALETLARWRFSVLMSLDGPAEAHDVQRPDIHGRPSHDRVLESMRWLRAEGLSVTLSATVTRANVHRWADIIDIASANGVSTVQFDPVGPSVWHSATNETWSRPDPAEYADAALAAFSAGRRQHVLVSNPIFARLFKPAAHYCDLVDGTCAVAVDWDGTLLSCVDVQAATHPLRGAYTLGGWDPARDRFVFTQPRPPRPCIQSKPPCSRCPARLHCAGGCSARAATASPAGGPDPFICAVVNRLLPGYLDLMAEAALAASPNA